MKSQRFISDMEGDRLLITISEEEYKLGIKVYKYNLYDRILWPKGSTPLIIVTIK